MDTSFEIQHCENSAIDQVDFNNIAFGKVFSDHVFIMDYEDGAWKNGVIEPFGPMSISPASMVLHYGQAIFEGMKAYRGVDDRIRMFRPMHNMARMVASAQRACLPTFDGGQLVECMRR